MINSGPRPSAPSRTGSAAYLVAALILLWAFFAATSALDRESLWTDEGWSLWAVHGTSPLTTLDRVGNDVHPPLYFVLLDGWIALVGESVYAVRMLSTLFALIALAATYALSKTLFDGWTGMIALVLLSTSGFLIYYAREARMYTLLVALSVLATWAHVRWLRRPSRSSAVIYAALMAGLVYTHYNGAWLIASYGLHILVTHPRRWGCWWGVLGLTLVFYAPWLPLVLHQMHLHSGGVWAKAAPFNGLTLSWLAMLLTGGQWGPIVLAWGTGRALPRLYRQRETLALLLIWFVLSPAVVFAVNEWVKPYYQPRYLIPILPAVVIGAAYAVRQVAWKPLAVGLLAWIAAGQMVMYPYLWFPKPHWKPTITALAAARLPSEPLLILIDPVGVEAYYARAYDVRRGAVIDFSPRPPDRAAVRAAAAAVSNAPTVWVLLPNTTFATWDVIAALDATRHMTYRDWVDKMVIYRFEQGDSADLHFRFGGWVTYGSRLGREFEVRPGDQLCTGLSLTAQQRLDGLLSGSLQVLDERRFVIAQDDTGLGTRAAGEAFAWARCLTVPDRTPPGDYRLMLVIYNWSTLERMRVIEGEGSGGFDWGDMLVVGNVTVEN